MEEFAEETLGRPYWIENWTVNQYLCEAVGSQNKIDEIHLQPILDKLQMLEEYGWELEEDLEELAKQTAIVSKENELQDIQIKEIKKKSNNPLAD